MALVGTLLFCTSCGELLDRQPAGTKIITCGVCESPNKNTWPTSVTTTSKPSTFPSSLRQKYSKIPAAGLEHAQTWPLTNQACPVCDNPELAFKELQLRSADEGTTILYHCLKCGHRFKSDN